MVHETNENLSRLQRAGIVDPGKISDEMRALIERLSELEVDMILHLHNRLPAYDPERSQQGVLFFF